MLETVEDVLEHHGIKGMRWGQRRKRGSNGRVDSGSKSGGKTQFTKSPSRLSDAELNRRIKRLEMEKKYSELSKSEAKPKSAGRAMAGKILKTSADNALTQATTQVMYFAVKKSIEKQFPKQAKELFPKKK